MRKLRFSQETEFFYARNLRLKNIARAAHFLLTTGKIASSFFPDIADKIEWAAEMESTTVPI